MNRKMVKSIIILILLQICLIFAVHAQGTYTAMTDVAGFKSKLALSSKNSKTIDCDFVQEKNMSMLTKKIISTGHFWYKQPGFIRWEYMSPYSYLVIIAKKKIFVKDDGNKKQYDTQSNSMFKGLCEMMFNFIRGNLTACEKDYTITYMENEQDYYLKLIPKSAKLKEINAQVDLYFYKKDFTVSKVKMLESGGDYTLLEFKNKKLNMGIADTVFSIK